MPTRKMSKFQQIMLLSQMVLLALAPAAFGDGSGGRVTLPLEGYLRLVEGAERVAEGRGAPSEPMVAELVAQATRLTVDGSTVEVGATYRVDFHGRPSKPVALPVTGLVRSATVEPKRGAALHRKGNELLLVAPEPGSYTVDVRARAALDRDGGVSKLKLAQSRAPIATLDLDLPADSSWTVGDAVKVEEVTDGERRRLRLAPVRGKWPVLELRRDATGAAEEETRARAVVLTVARVGDVGVERHDVVFYEVTRGELSRFAVDVPAALEVAKSITDEGSVLPLVEAGLLTVERRRRLAAKGHLALTYQPLAVDTERVALPPLVPAVPVRSRYLVLASDRAAELEPLPLEAWARVDLDDLPRGTRREVVGLGANSVWRRTESVAEPSLRAALRATVDALSTVIEQRSTTTLLTVDGSLVHRDVFTLQQAGASLELALPAAATLWSVKVDDLAVRPLELGGTLTVPLAFKAEGETEVELVTVEAQRLDRGTHRFGIELARVAAPVLEHQWRLLVPEQHRYRLATSVLSAVPPHAASRPASRSIAQAKASVIESISGDSGIAGSVVDENNAGLPGVTVSLSGASGKIDPSTRRPYRTAATDLEGRFAFFGLAPGVYDVTAELEGFQTLQVIAVVPDGRTAQLELMLQVADVVEEIIVTSQVEPIGFGSTVLARDEIGLWQRKQAARHELESFQQGLVGGVKPLAVEIPESGKLLLLAGVLPPRQVAVELEVKMGR